MAPGFWAAGLGVALAAAAPATADEAPKYGGTLTYMIPANSPPSFDAQREADDVGSRFRIVGIDPSPRCRTAPPSGSRIGLPAD